MARERARRTSERSASVRVCWLNRARSAAAERARFSQHTLTEAERSDVLRALSRAIRAAGAALPPGRAALFRFLFRFPKP